VINVLLFEDNEDFVDSFKELLHSSNQINLCATFPHCQDIVRHVNFYKPDIIVMDIDMKPVNGLEGLRLLRQAQLDVTIIMLTVFDDNDRVFQAVCNGASGYLLKSSTPERIVTSIQEAYDGGAPMTPSVAKQVLKLFSAPFLYHHDLQKLTPREHDVLSLLVRGFSYKMAANEMNISIETLRYHVKNIYAKLHVNSKSEAVAKAIQNKLI
jgi:DNA-binding NarL/FixJ family response regulator